MHCIFAVFNQSTLSHSSPLRVCRVDKPRPRVVRDAEVSPDAQVGASHVADGRHDVGTSSLDSPDEAEDGVCAGRCIKLKQHRQCPLRKDAGDQVLLEVTVRAQDLVKLLVVGGDAHQVHLIVHQYTLTLHGRHASRHLGQQLQLDGRVAGREDEAGQVALQSRQRRQRVAVAAQPVVLLARQMDSVPQCLVKEVVTPWARSCPSDEMLSLQSKNKRTIRKKSNKGYKRYHEHWVLARGAPKGEGQTGQLPLLTAQKVCFSVLVEPRPYDLLSKRRQTIL